MLDLSKCRFTQMCLSLYNPTYYINWPKIVVIINCIIIIGISNFKMFALRNNMVQILKLPVKT